MTKEEIGAILKELRLNSGQTQKQVAEALGRNQQIIGHWETGYSQPDANTLFVLCELYNVSIDDAFGFSKLKSQSMLNEHEYNVITSYRNQPQMQPAVDKLLGIIPPNEHIKF